MAVEKMLPRAFYARDTELVARELLGKMIVREEKGKICSGIIVETEAYVCSDAACHAYRGKTESNKALFGPVGHAYIYFIYGMYFCLNVVARKKTVPAGGILIRALEPIEGIEQMRMRRKTSALHNLTSGPGKLAQALHITKALYGCDVTKKGPIYITQGVEIKKSDIVASKRIGISKEQERAWRFYCKDNSFVSKV
jgi:DNA-3-methyladenine glycosylase